MNGRRYVHREDLRRDMLSRARRVDALVAMRRVSKQAGAVARGDAETVTYAANRVQWMEIENNPYIPNGTPLAPRIINVRFFLLRTEPVAATLQLSAVLRILESANQILEPAGVAMYREGYVDPFHVPELESNRGPRLQHSQRTQRVVARALRPHRLRGAGNLNVVILSDMVYPSMDVQGSHMPGSDFVFVDQTRGPANMGRTLVHEFLHRIGQREHYTNARHQGNIMYTGRGRWGTDINGGQIRYIRRYASPADGIE